MAADKRNAQEIRRELAGERDQLADALTALREDVHGARRIPIIAGGALLAGVVAFAAVKFALSRGD
jgi:hypothetical protein